MEILNCRFLAIYQRKGVHVNTPLNRHFLIAIFISSITLLSGCNNEENLLAEKAQLTNQINAEQRNINQLNSKIVRIKEDLVAAEANFERVKNILSEATDIEKNIRNNSSSDTYGISRPEFNLTDIKLNIKDFNNEVYLTITLTNNSKLYIEKGYVDLELDSDSAGEIRLTELEFEFGGKPLAPKQTASTRITLYSQFNPPGENSNPSSDKRLLFTKEYGAIVTLREIVDIDKGRHNVIPAKKVRNLIFSNAKKPVSKLQGDLENAQYKIATKQAEISKSNARIRAIDSEINT